jgi:FkbM family methyltransferase
VGYWQEPYFTFHGLGVSGTQAWNNLLHSTVDPDEYVAAASLMQLGDRVLVAGNGMGSVSVLLAARFGRGSVIAYEANPTLVELTKGWICFPDGCMEVEHGALGARDGTTHLRIAERWAESSVHPEWAPNQVYTDRLVEVPLVDTNRVVRERGINALLLDVEGSEHDIIPTLDFAPIRWFVAEIHGSDERAAALKDILRANGLTVVAEQARIPDYQRTISAARGGITSLPSRWRRRRRD